MFDRFWWSLALALNVLSNELHLDTNVNAIFSNKEVLYSLLLAWISLLGVIY